MDVTVRHLPTTDTINNQVIEDISVHNQLVHIVEVTPYLASNNRDLVIRSVWKKLNDASYFFVISSEDRTDYPANTDVDNNRLMPSSSKKRGVIRALCTTTIKLSRIRENETNIEYLTHFDIGGTEKAGNLIGLYLLKRLKSIVAMQTYFQKLRPLEVLDESDGKAIGIAFNLQRKSERSKIWWRERWLGFHVKKSVAIVIKDDKALRGMSEMNRGLVI